MGGLVLLPRRDAACELEFGERAVEQFAFGGVRIEALELRGLDLQQRMALYEQPLHAEHRRELVVRCGQRGGFGLDAEQPRDEILEVRRERDQQFRLRLVRELVGGGARGE